MMFFIPKYIEYNYHHYSFIRTPLAQNTTIALSVMWSTGSHLGFYIDIMVVFQNYCQKCIFAPKHPRVEVLLMIVAPQGQLLHWGPFSLFAHLHHAHALNMLTKISPKLLKQQLS